MHEQAAAHAEVPASFVEAYVDDYALERDGELRAAVLRAAGATPLHSRADAGLRPPDRQPPAIAAEAVTVHWGGPSPWGGKRHDHTRCAGIWRAWQAYHMSKGWADIAYSSGVCPGGHRYEGRGPGRRTAAQGTNDGNRRSLAVCYIAGDGDPLTEAATRAFADEARRFGVPLRWPHHFWHSTACPGAPLTSWAAAGFPPPPSPAPVPSPAPGRETYDHPEGTVARTIFDFISTDADGNGWWPEPIPKAAFSGCGAFHETRPMAPWSGQPHGDGTYVSPDSDRDSTDEDPAARPVEHEGALYLVVKGAVANGVVRFWLTRHD